jgi:hypothetical protein
MKIATRGFLENTQAELWRQGQQMIENISLDILVFDPIGGSGKDIYLNGQAGWAGVKLAHQ